MFQHLETIPIGVKDKICLLRLASGLQLIYHVHRFLPDHHLGKPIGQSNSGSKTVMVCLKLAQIQEVIKSVGKLIRYLLPRFNKTATYVVLI